MPTTALVMAFSLLLVALFGSHLALADHVTCSYKPGNKNPFTYDYALLCTALSYKGENGVEWRCDGRGTGNSGTVVGNWDLIKRNTIEVLTPCGYNGFGVNRFDGCYGPLWAFCLGDSDDGNCFYLSSTDDCEWPHPTEYKDLPRTVQVWYRYY